jgi:hypothetical protein
MSCRRAALAAALAALALACNQPTPDDAERARAGITDRAQQQPDSAPDLVEARVPSAKAGEDGWKYAQRATLDLDGDGKPETLVLTADVTVDPSGRPLWEDGHQWQVYVEGSNGSTTRVYARFLPNGKLTARISPPDGGVRPTVLLLEEMPDRLRVHEFRYRGPGAVDVWTRVDRRLDPATQLTGSPLP